MGVADVAAIVFALVTPRMRLAAMAQALQLPPQPKRGLRSDRRSRDDLELVTVLTTGDHGLLAIAESMLQSAGIPCAVQGGGVLS